MKVRLRMFHFGGLSIEFRRWGQEAGRWQLRACWRQAPVVQKCCRSSSKGDSLPGCPSRSGYTSPAHDDSLHSCVHASTLMLSRLDISTKCPFNMGFFKLYQS